MLRHPSLLYLDTSPTINLACFNVDILELTPYISLYKPKSPSGEIKAMRKEEVEMEMESLRKWTCLKSQRKSTLTAVDAMEELRSGRVITREGENGAVRVKIVVSKQELRRMVATMGVGQRRSNPTSLEQLLHALRERRMERAEAAGEGRRGDWRPELQSIPEEV